MKDGSMRMGSCIASLLLLLLVPMAEANGMVKSRGTKLLTIERELSLCYRIAAWKPLWIAPIRPSKHGMRRCNGARIICFEN